MEKEQQFRPHMTKEQRLPKCFKEVEKILRSVKSCQKNYKTILANSRLRGNTHKKVYSMTVNVLKNYNYIQKIIDKIQLLEKEKFLRKEIASVLIYELIFGHGFLPGESKVVKIIQMYEKDIFHAHEVLQNTFESSLSIDINIPRYVRVHTLVTTVPYVIKDLISCGFHQVLYDEDLSEEKYLEHVKTLSKGSFLIDFHFKDVLVFERKDNLVALDLYKNGHIFLQDKSSCIPVHILNPEPGCAVLDACAAPGMKTVHIAAKMKNKGLLIACERDKSRFECLKEMLDCGSVKICKAFCKDFKLIDPCDQAYSTIEYILLDPSCSGSGMVNRMDEVTDTENSKNTERLLKLAGFQIILLKHSLKFPSVKRVVYSTCSIHEEENEYVVHEALRAFNQTFKLIPAMPEWSHRGSEKFEFGKLCLRTDPKVHLTNGFFVAVFERISYDENTEQCQNNYNMHDGSGSKKQKKKFSKPKDSNEKTATEHCDDINLKHKGGISYPLETDQMNDSEHFALLYKNGESLENSTQNADYELEQNSAYAQQINKKHKKKKKSKECSYESNELNLEMSNESSCSKLKEYSNISFSENNEFTDVSNLPRKKNKKKKDHFEAAMLQPTEKCLPEDSNLHRKKKKAAMLQPTEKCLPESNKMSQEQPNVFSVQKSKISELMQEDNILHSDSAAIFTSKDVTLPKDAQNKHTKNISDENSEELISMTSHKKKKKKKKHLNIDYVQSYENCTSLSCATSDSSSLRNIETPEVLSDLTLLHKKKKKKKKHSVEKDA